MRVGIKITEDEISLDTLNPIKEHGYTIIEIDDKYADCEPLDFNLETLEFDVEKYEARKQKANNAVTIEKLDSWFENDYKKYEQMFTRRKALGIEDVIEDEFRNRVGDKAYHNLIELYEEAEVVAKEIRELRK